VEKPALRKFSAMSRSAMPAVGELLLEPGFRAARVVCQMWDIKRPSWAVYWVVRWQITDDRRSACLD